MARGKAIWEGTISFGLVSIPVKLYSVAEPKQFSFHLLCPYCKAPLKYKRYCPKCKKEISWQETVKGIKIGKEFKIFKKEELKKLRPENFKRIEIIAFSSFDEFDPLLFNKNYFVLPASKDKAYFLFQQAMSALALVAIARMILHEKEYTVILRPYKKGILLTTLFYPREIRKIEDFKELKTRQVISKKEFKLALQLIKNLKKKINLEEFEDSFEKKLKEILLGKIKKEKERKPKPEKLIEALQLSVKNK